MPIHVKAMATAIAARYSLSPSHPLIQRAAEASVTLQRVREARGRAITDALHDPKTFDPLTSQQRLDLLEKLIGALDRNKPYEASDLTEKLSPQVPAEAGVRLALTITHTSSALLRLERYEHRAFTKLRSAIRKLDKLRL